MIRTVGAVGAILWGVVGISKGLAQQTSGLAPESIDCAYRVKLLRDRVVALTERSPHQRANDPQNDVVSNLIRETRTACAARGDIESTKRLDLVAARLRDHLLLGTSEEQARRELLAL
jgi:hypothetical protein